jgi:2-dehydro-3-deoxyphosphogluconate aldolase / (4S)-4-hydroxy-2-oxoglutarate aldolase
MALRFAVSKRLPSISPFMHIGDLMNDTITQRIDAVLHQAPVVPVLAVSDLDDAVPLAEALVAAGLPVLEITLRTPVALEVIRRMREVPGAIVGAGTVLTRDAVSNTATTASNSFPPNPAAASPRSRASAARSRR